MNFVFHSESDWLERPRNMVEEPQITKRLNIQKLNSIPDNPRFRAAFELLEKYIHAVNILLDDVKCQRVG